MKSMSDPLTLDDIANEYDKCHYGRPARTLPIEEVLRWAEAKKDIFYVDKVEETFHRILPKEKGKQAMKWKFYVAGVQFHDYKKVTDVQAGQTLKMIPEPTNQYDRNAIKLHLGDHFIGFVPGKISAEVSAFLSHTDNPVCTITAYNPTEKPWKMFEVEIKESDNA